MNIERLALMVQMLAEVVKGEWVASGSAVCKITQRKDPIRKFDLSTWVSRVSCGFSACAVGHACLDSRFNKLGLSYNFERAVPKYNNNTNWKAVEKFFDIKEETAELLFMIRRYQSDIADFDEWRNPQPADVIRRILLLIELGETQAFTDAINQENNK